jgi:predicted protein tyrosine phosphatase
MIQDSVRIFWRLLPGFMSKLRTASPYESYTWLVGHLIPSVSGVPNLKFCQITPQIYVGGQHGRRGKRLLELEGITGDVNMRIEYDDAEHGVALEHTCHLPTIDDTEPTLEHLAEGAAFIDRLVRAGEKVYIHCAGGIGRAPTMAAAYFITQGMTLDDALALIQEKRPFINPQPCQIEQLKRFEKQQHAAVAACAVSEAAR